MIVANSIEAFELSWFPMKNLTFFTLNIKKKKTLDQTAMVNDFIRTKQISLLSNTQNYTYYAMHSSHFKLTDKFQLVSIAQIPAIIKIKIVFFPHLSKYSQGQPSFCVFFSFFPQILYLSMISLFTMNSKSTYNCHHEYCVIFNPDAIAWNHLIKLSL